MKPEEFSASLPITVPFDLHEAMREAESEAFAISYLCGAVVEGGMLRPRTGTARERLSESKAALRTLEVRGLHLGRALSRDEREPIPAVADALRRHDRTGKWA